MGIALGFIFVTDFFRFSKLLKRFLDFYVFFVSLRKICEKFGANGEIGYRKIN